MQEIQQRSIRLIHRTMPAFRGVAGDKRYGLTNVYKSVTNFARYIQENAAANWFQSCLTGNSWEVNTPRPARMTDQIRISFAQKMREKKRRNSAAFFTSQIKAGRSMHEPLT